jgi:CubicO group peptidase (beta-lactamase class C family)
MIRIISAMAILLASCNVCLAQTPDPNSANVKTLKAFVQLLERKEVDLAKEANEVLDANQLEELKKKVILIRSKIAGNRSMDVMLESETSGRLEIELPGQAITVRFEMTSTSPVRINKITIDNENQHSERAPITWENLSDSIEQAAVEGFEGALLVTRNGEIVFQKGFGFANREKKIKNNIVTVFGIGSQPIDFTHVAILLLKDQGKLKLSDPITKFFPDVPKDKQAITIRHLMTGRSGFPDFHDQPSDENKDHTWIDRDEAVRRMLAHELLFEPGRGESHSHSAWGMLAAIVEIVSGESYQAFTKKNLFEPAGMLNTGFYGDAVPVEQVAVGYGELKSSEPNSPPHWGKTSWLVMGSGGQVSTLPDLLRWETAVKAAKILSLESTEAFLQQHRGLAMDGSMYGFEFMHSYDPESLFLLISNSVDSRDKRQSFKELGSRLHRLINRSPAGNEGESQPRVASSKFSLGVIMTDSGEGDVVINQIVPGSAAARDGLQVEDRLISANGNSFDKDSLSVLQPLLQDGKPIKFEVERTGRVVTVTVTPNPK